MSDHPCQDMPIVFHGLFPMQPRKRACLSRMQAGSCTACVEAVSFLQYPSFLRDKAQPLPLQCISPLYCVDFRGITPAANEKRLAHSTGRTSREYYISPRSTHQDLHIGDLDGSDGSAVGTTSRQKWTGSQFSWCSILTILPSVI